MVGASCSVRTCYFSKPSKHRFPNPRKDIHRFKKWLLLVGNKELLKRSPDEVYANCRVCADHFVSSDFGPNNVLLKSAVPSLKLPDPLDIQEYQQIEVSMELNDQQLSMVHSDINFPTSTELIVAQTKSATEYMDDEKMQIYSSTEASVEPVAGPSEVKQIRDVPINTISPLSSTKASVEPIAGPSGIKRIRDVPMSTIDPPPSLLKEVDVTRKADLTPKAKYFYEKTASLKRRISKLELSKKSLKKKLFAIKSKEDDKISSMDRIRKRFFDSQLENVARKPKGRRFTFEDKVLALALYKHSGATYKFMSRIFALPSRRSISNLLNKIPIKPGFNEEVFSVLRAEVKNLTNPQDKICILMFDEMSIQAALAVNKSEGTVVGFEDYGYRTSDQIANHVQVYMLRGVRRKWKQPIYYNFCSGATKYPDIKKILKEIIRKCNDIGLQVIATVCDQGTNNVSAINSLIKEKKEKYLRLGMEVADETFEIDGKEVIPLYDIPHLFKGIRNNLIKYNIQFEEEGEEKVAKWQHIQTMYDIDSFFGGLKLCPKLTDRHIYPTSINKMKVSICCQVFSHSVAVALNMMARTGVMVQNDEEVLKLEPEATDTAIFIKFMDSLFDSLNGSTFQSTKMLRVAVRKNSPHLKFWDEALIKLRSFRCRKNNSLFIPPSIKNLIKTLINFKVLYRKLSNYFEYMMPRTFNQDPLENFFGQIRQRGHRLVNPPPETFSATYKSILVKNLTSHHSFAANCEDDDSEIFLSLQRLVSQEIPVKEDVGVIYSTVPEDLPSKHFPLERRILKYIAGFLLKKNKKNKIEKCYCTEIFLLRQNLADFEDDDLTKEKEYDKTKNSLFYVNREFLGKISRAYAIIRYVLNVDLHKKGILLHLLHVLQNRIQLTSCDHNYLISSTIFKYLINIIIHHDVKEINNVIKGHTKYVPKNCNKFFRAAKKMQLMYSKYKK